MKPLVGTREAIVLIGLAACIGPPALDHDVTGAGPLLLIQLAPFGALAAAAPRLSPTGALMAAGVFAAAMVETQREIAASSSSTASIALGLVPLLLVAMVPVLIAAADVVRVARALHAGSSVRPPTPGQIGVTLLAVAVGGFALMIPGAVLGLCLGIIVWTADAIQDA
jgi:hypothetical protein